MQKLTLPIPTLFACHAYHPIKGGFSYQMQTMLDAYQQGSLEIAGFRPSRQPTPEEAEQLHPFHTVFQVHYKLPKKLVFGMLRAQRTRAARKVAKLAERMGAGAIVAVYPQLMMLDAAVEASKMTGLPLLLYIHDTISEGLAHSPLGSYAPQVQQRAFEQAGRILVVSEGLQDLYRSKYGLETHVVEHPYTEPIPEEPPAREVERSMLFAGAIYEINRSSLQQVVNAAKQIEGLKIRLTSPAARTMLREMDWDDDRIVSGFLPTRSDYLDMLSSQAVHLLTLDRPDECSMHPDELKTIFPTKGIDYLSSGRPIFVLCPEDYFMSRFYRENECGVVLNERDPDAIEAALRDLLDGGDERLEMRRNGLRAARRFRLERIAGLFRDHLKTLLGG